MSRRFSGIFVAFAVLAAGLPGQACSTRAAGTKASAVERNDAELDRMARAVEAALTAEPPGGYARVPAGVRLRSIARDERGAIVMDFSRELLAGGAGRVLEDALHQILSAAASARPDGERDAEFRILVNGAPLEKSLP